MPDTDALALLTAKEAAAILRVDVKTFRAMPVPFVTAGLSRRYTRAILASWLERSVQCPTPLAPRGKRQGGKLPGSNISGSGQGRRIGRLPSGSNIIEFEKVAGLTIEPPPRLSPSSGGKKSGGRSSSASRPSPSIP